MVGAQFSRVRPSENRSGERLRTATARKNDEKCVRRRLRTHFFAPGPVFGRFWDPGRVPKLRKSRPWETRRLFWEHTFSIFWRFLRSGAFRKGPGAIPEAPGTLPDQILRGFCDACLQLPSGSCRGLSGSAGAFSSGFPQGHTNGHIYMYTYTCRDPHTPQ